MLSPPADVHDVPWDIARDRAWTTFGPVAPITLPLSAATGAVLASPARAVTDLPPMTTSAMDGWAVAGTGPWRVLGQVLAGQSWPGSIAPGEAVAIATGAPLPAGATAVLRREDGQRQDPDGVEWVRCTADVEPATGLHIRAAGQECSGGDEVLPAGTVVSASGIGLLAAAGLDEVEVRRAQADVLVLGDELLTSGPSRGGKLRDALGPLLSAWLPARGVELRSRMHVGDSAQALRAAMSGCSADVLVTTGSTARGPVDHLHEVLESLGAELIIDGVRVRPGHPMLLARLDDGRPLVGLPGNPLAAVSGLLTLFDPVARALRGLGREPLRTTALTVEVPAGPQATRLLPVHEGRPVTYAGPAMLRGLVAADLVAVIPPGGLPTGVPTQALTPP